jgi:hypothetical protein
MGRAWRATAVRVGVWLEVRRLADGSSVLRSTGSDVCYVARTTADPDALQLWSCRAGKASDPSLGLLRRGPPLIREIRPDDPELSIGGRPYVLGVDPTQRWVVVGVGDQLSLWKSDVDQRFDIGRGPVPLPDYDTAPMPGTVDFSSDGRYVAYYRPTDANGGNALVLFDTTVGAERILEPRLDVRGGDETASVARFSPDGRRIVFYGNLQDDGLHSDLAAVDLDNGERVTLLPNRIARLLGDCVWFTRSDHVVFCVEGDQISSDSAPLQSYEFSTGARRDLGTVRDVLTAPDGSYLTLTTVDGEIELFEDADWTPRLLGRSYDPSNPVQTWAHSGMTPSPDGRLLAFVEQGGTFHVYDTIARTMSSLSDGAGCFLSVGPAPEQEVARLAASAYFLADGQTLIHPLWTGHCAADNGATGIARYDLTTNQEQTATLGDGTQLVQFGPRGELVYASFSQGLRLLTWESPASPAPLPPAGSFMFSQDDHYLLSFASDSIITLDLASATTTAQSASLRSASFWGNPQTGVSLVEADQIPPPTLTLYPPGMAARTLATWPASVEISPSGSAAVYQGADALYVVRLEPTATPRAIGSLGAVLGISDRHVFFRAVDGICALPL